MIPKGRGSPAAKRRADRHQQKSRGKQQRGRRQQAFLARQVRRSSVFCAVKNGPRGGQKTVARYAIQRSARLLTSKNDNAIATRARSVAIITCLRENLSTKVPAIGEASANGSILATKKMPAAVGDASDTKRTNPNPAMKLNQFPSSEMNCPAS